MWKNKASNKSDSFLNYYQISFIPTALSGKTSAGFSGNMIWLCRWNKEYLNLCLSGSSRSMHSVITYSTPPLISQFYLAHVDFWKGRNKENENLPRWHDQSYVAGEMDWNELQNLVKKVKSHNIRHKNVYAVHGCTAATKTEVSCSEIAEADKWLICRFSLQNVI